MPSRAYLKLWEAFTVLGIRPAPGDFCIDLGASPGGWTWVLQSLGARVLSIDKGSVEQDVDLRDRGLLFVPSAFAWPDVVLVTDPRWQPTLVYPARGVGTLWETDRPAAPEAAELALFPAAPKWPAPRWPAARQPASCVFH